jgi:hypothetical protein
MIVDLALKKFPDEYKGTKGKEGDYLKNNPKLFKLSTKKLESELGIKPKSFDECFTDTMKSLFELRKEGK